MPGGQVEVELGPHCVRMSFTLRRPSAKFHTSSPMMRSESYLIFGSQSCISSAIRTSSQ